MFLFLIFNLTKKSWRKVNPNKHEIELKKKNRKPEKHFWKTILNKTTPKQKHSLTKSTFEKPTENTAVDKSGRWSVFLEFTRHF